MNNKTPIQSPPSPGRAELLKTVGVAVLILGLIASNILYWGGEKNSVTSSSRRESPLWSSSREQKMSELGGSWKDGTLSPEDTKGSSRTTEMNYGKIAVLIASWLHRWEELKPHQFLAIVIATMATLIAIGCFLIAQRLRHEEI